ncbi:MAG: tryptophan synthase subunit beta [Cyanobacteriota bacterium]
MLNDYNYPDSFGRFGEFGGKYVPETLMYALTEFEEAFNKYINDIEFKEEFSYLLKHYVGRPSPLYYAKRLSDKLGGNTKVYLKREDLNHTGAHKINNALGQCLIAKRLGKPRVIAETGAGQHGVATATACALLGIKCEVYMGTEDIRRQSLNVYRMELLGSKVIPVSSGSGTLKDATSEAIRDWVTNVKDTHYVLGSVAGPHPYPKVVRCLQSMIGDETYDQIMEMEGKLPDHILACVGGGSNAIGIFYKFLPYQQVNLIGVEAAGKGIASGKHAATLTEGSPGILHGSFSYVLQDKDGQILEAHSISAGLDYPGVGPEHSYLKSIGRVKYVNIDDNQALDALQLLTRLEGIIPALESAHALAYLPILVNQIPDNQIIILNLSGRGDKDVITVSDALKG